MVCTGIMNSQVNFLRDRSIYEWASTKAKTLPKLKSSGPGTGTLQQPLDTAQWPDFVLGPSNPTFDPLLCADNLSPMPFRLRRVKVVFWAPHIFWNSHLPNHKPSCPVCKSSEKVVVHGWSPQLRRLSTLGNQYFIYGYNYTCKECPGNNSRLHRILLRI